jgi:hypothetical protein
VNLRVARAMREDRGRFAALRDARVLIYWPHGLGDWTHIGAIVPLLEASNRYAMTRFGDDYTSLMDGNAYVEAIHSGRRALGDGSESGAPHLGVRRDRLRGGPADLVLPEPLGARVANFAPDALLWTDYPETEGRTAYPFHTKARNLARLLVRPERLATFALHEPLRNSIDFAAPPEVQREVDERLARFAGPQARFCAISRAGVTAARKNWGDGSEARAFVSALHAHHPQWRVVSMDDEALGDGVVGFRALFGDVAAPFAAVYKALAARLALFAGVPAGPLHVTMARGGVPAVGLWLAHHPDWYDEPNPAATHLIGAYVRERGFHRRPATTTTPPSLRHRIEYLDERTISGSVAFEAARALL